MLALDPNVRPLLVSDEPGLRARLDRWLGLVDLVKVSDEDLAWLCPGEPVEAVARRWRERGAAVVVVTRGGEGVHALGPAGPVDLPARPVQVADTVGAGDSFMGGLLAALSERDLLSRPALDALADADLREVLALRRRGRRRHLQPPRRRPALARGAARLLTHRPRTRSRAGASGPAPCPLVATAAGPYHVAAGGQAGRVVCLVHS